MDEPRSVLCPSSRAKPGAKLLGVRQDDGTVAILPQVLQIDLSFLANTPQDIKAERQFRFTNACVEGGCVQWTGSRCGIADQALEHSSHVPAADGLIACSIRQQCRWFLQSGAEACTICPYILTEITEEEALDYIKRAV